MTLRLEDKWVWDFWFARDRDDRHVFYLQAPRELVDPERRHKNASIGHAISTDLTHWSILPDALHPGEPGSWDDLATWTGSVIEHNGRWQMLYTGISSADDGLVQRIGLASSDDLVNWHKHEANPVLEADPRWYEMLDLTRWRDQSWRDPWLFRDPADEFVHVLITARVPHGPSDGAGVVAHARSMDLVTWEVLPPLTEPGEFAQVEVPQLVPLEDRYALLISTLAEDHSRARLARVGGVGQTGTFVLVSSEMLGSYKAGALPLTRSDRPAGPLYAGKVVQATDGQWAFIGFGGDGLREFTGELSDPIPARPDGERGFVVEDPRAPSDSELARMAPEIRSLIAWGTTVSERYRDLDVPELRIKIASEHDAEMRRLGLGLEPVASVTDHRIQVETGEITVRLFLPETPGPHPVFLHFHGGGFVFGSIDSVVNDAKCSTICRRAECAVATVDYRLAPEHRFPTAAEDCSAALQFIVENAEDLGIDARRVAVGGESAGGNLAAVVALMARDRGGPELALQLLEVPVTDLRAAAGTYPSAAEFAVGYGLDQADMDYYAREYLAPGDDGTSAYASPLAAEDLTGLPAAHVMTAEYDVLRDSGEAYARRLEDAGVPVTLQRMAGHTHGSPVLWATWRPAAEWMDSLIGALARSLREQREEVL
jgi:beta-fructofuranosidase